MIDEMMYTKILKNLIVIFKNECCIFFKQWNMGLEWQRWVILSVTDLKESEICPNLEANLASNAKNIIKMAITLLF